MYDESLNKFGLTTYASLDALHSIERDRGASPTQSLKPASLALTHSRFDHMNCNKSPILPKRQSSAGI